MRQAILVALTVVVALVVSRCSDSGTGPSSDGRALALSFTVAGGPADAFDRADQLAIRVVAGGSVAVDTVIGLTANGSDARVRLRLPRGADTELSSIEVEVRLGSEPLFRGSAANLTLTGRSDPVEITLQPVVARIVGPSTMPTITTLGGTLRLTAAAVFATGDTIPNTPFTWTAMDRDIAMVSGDGVVTAVTEGEGRIQVRYGAAVATLTVRVRASVARVQVTPDRMTIFVGGSQTFTATARDEAGNALTRTATWASSNPAIATVTANGNAVGTAVGSARIEATIEGVTGTAQLTVAATVPSAPTSLAAQPSGNTVRLSWTDNSTNETSYQVRRGAPGATQTDLVATLGPNVTMYAETPGPDRVLQYVVLACNAAGCSTPASITTRTVPAPPSQLRVSVTDRYYGGVLVEWTDGSVAETGFRLEGIFDDSQEADWTTVVTTPANTTSQAVTLGYFVEFAVFRVLACNEAGCSAPSEEVLVYFFSGGSTPPSGMPAPVDSSRKPARSGDALLPPRAPR